MWDQYFDVGDIRSHLNLTEDDDDAMIEGLLDAAFRHALSYVGAESVENIFPVEDFPAGPPSPFLHAVLMLAGHFYEHRETSLAGVTMQQVNPGAYDLLAPYRVWCF